MSMLTLDTSVSTMLRVDLATEDDLDALAAPWNAIAGEIPFRSLAPWYLHRSRVWGQVVRFLGSGLVYSDYLTLLADSSQEREVATAVADWLTAEQHRWDSIELNRVQHLAQWDG